MPSVNLFYFTLLNLFVFKIKLTFLPKHVQSSDSSVQTQFEPFAAELLEARKRAQKELRKSRLKNQHNPLCLVLNQIDLTPFVASHMVEPTSVSQKPFDKRLVWTTELFLLVVNNLYDEAINRLKAQSHIKKDYVAQARELTCVKAKVFSTLLPAMVKVPMRALIAETLRLVTLPDWSPWTFDRKLTATISNMTGVGAIQNGWMNAQVVNNVLCAYPICFTGMLLGFCRKQADSSCKFNHFDPFNSSGFQNIGQSAALNRAVPVPMFIRRKLNAKLPTFRGRGRGRGRGNSRGRGKGRGRGNGGNTD